MLEGRKINVGVLGATGTVGQRFIALLSEHPFFVLRALGASQRSAGKPYGRAVTWKQTKYVPAVVREMVVQECRPELFAGCEIVFSGLDADVAGPIGTSAAFCMGFEWLNGWVWFAQRRRSVKQSSQCSQMRRIIGGIPTYPSSYPSSMLPTSA